MYSQLTQGLHKTAQQHNVTVPATPGGQSCKNDGRTNNYNNSAPQYSELIARLASGQDVKTEETPLRGHYGSQQRSATQGVAEQVKT